MGKNLYEHVSMSVVENCVLDNGKLERLVGVTSVLEIISRIDLTPQWRPGSKYAVLYMNLVH